MIYFCNFASEMKKYLLLLLLIITGAIANAQETDGTSNVQQRLDSLLQHPMFQTSQVAMMVYDLMADSVIYQLNAQQLMRPASTMKVVTAITALDHLSGDYQLCTRLYHTGELMNGKLTGNLYCVGGFDPRVTELDIKALAHQLHQLGVDTLEGHVIADKTMKENLEYGEGWCWDDDNPKLIPLTIGRKDNFVNRLIQEMKNDGVEMSNASSDERRCPETAALLALRTHSIDELLWRMMKKSDNFYAEALFYQIAAALTNKRSATAADARTAVNRLIRRVGLNDKDYRIADGSGLSLYNYVSAELEVRLLRYAWQNEKIFNHLYPSLPIAGVDGTLEKRMRKTAAEGNVHAKTGTVTGISSLAGYLTTADGRPLAFCIINQGILRSQPGRDFQDRVCRVLCE